MTLAETKKRMKAYKDFYGGELFNIEEIDSCKTLFALSEILDKHNNFMESMLSDAQSHLRNFRKQLELN